MSSSGRGFTEPPEPILPTRAIAVNRPYLCRRLRLLLLLKRMNNEENDCDADTGIGHVERRPRMREWHMQIEEQKIDHMSVKQAVGQISEHTREQERE
jgi:hypothetical protein